VILLLIKGGGSQIVGWARTGDFCWTKPAAWQSLEALKEHVLFPDCSLTFKHRQIDEHVDGLAADAQHTTATKPIFFTRRIAMCPAKKIPAQLSRGTDRNTTRSSVDLVKWQSVAPAAEFPSSLVDRAKELDQDLRRTWAATQKNVIRIGQILLEMMNNRMHVALGYSNFEHYVHEAVGHCKTQAFEAMKVVRELTTGRELFRWLHFPKSVAKMRRA